MSCLHDRTGAIWTHPNMAVIVESAFRQIRPLFAGKHSHLLQHSNTISVAICRFLTQATRGLKEALKSGTKQHLEECEATFIAAVPSILSLHMTHFKRASMLFNGGRCCGITTPRPDMTGTCKVRGMICWKEREKLAAHAWV